MESYFVSGSAPTRTSANVHLIRVVGPKITNRSFSIMSKGDTQIGPRSTMLRSNLTRDAQLLALAYHNNLD